MKLHRVALPAVLAALVAVPAAQASITASIDFGTVTAPVTRTVTFQNPSVNAVTVTGAGVNGSRQAGPFVLTGSPGCLGVQLAHGQSCQQDVTIDPTVVPPGEFDATFILTYDDAGTPTTASTDLTGVADGAANISVVSDTPGGVRADGKTVQEEISSDGRFVAFSSEATNLVPGFGPAPHFGSFDTNEVYLRDRQSNTIVPISVNTTGGSADRGALVDAVSADGRYVLFSSESPDLVAQPFPGATIQVFLRDVQENTTTLVSTNTSGDPSNQGSGGYAVMSSDAHIVCFDTTSTNMAPHERLNVPELFCKNLSTGRTRRADPGVGGRPPNVGIDSGSESISADGGYVVFSSASSNLVANDTNKKIDVFLYNRHTNRVRRINTTAGGQTIGFSQIPSIDGDGTKVAFHHFSDGWWVKNLITGRARRVARDSSPDGPATMSPDGQLYSFTLVVAGHTEVYVENLRTGKRRLVSMANGNAGNGESYMPEVASDGSVTFLTTATNLKVIPDAATSEAMTWTR
jgi:Tol biopolymer transport system component